MKLRTKIIVGLVVVFGGIQFLPSTYNQSNEILSTDLSRIYNVPKDVESILRTSCYDCHSNNTKYPWYNKVKPVTWYLQNHIEEGKKELNFSIFGEYSERKRRSKLHDIANQIKSDGMPLSSYLLMHRNAKITESKKTILLNWIDSLE